MLKKSITQKNLLMLACVLLLLMLVILLFLPKEEKNISENPPTNSPTRLTLPSPTTSQNPSSSSTPKPIDKNEYTDADKIKWSKKEFVNPQPTILPPLLIEEYIQALFSSTDSTGLADSTVLKWISPKAKNKNLPTGPPASSRADRISTSGTLINLEYKEEGDYYLAKIEMKETFKNPPTTVTNTNIYLGIKITTGKNGNPLVKKAQYLTG